MGLLDDISAGLRQAGRVLSPAVSEQLGQQESQDQGLLRSVQLAVLQNKLAQSTPEAKAKLAQIEAETATKQQALKNLQGFQAKAKTLNPQSPTYLLDIAQAATESGNQATAVTYATAHLKRIDDMQTRADSLAERGRQFDQQLQFKIDSTPSGEEKMALEREKIASREAIARQHDELIRVIKASQGPKDTPHPILGVDANGNQTINWARPSQGTQTFDTKPASLAGGGAFTPEALKFTAKQYLAGDRQAIQGFARNATAKIALQNAIVDEAQSQGLSPQQTAAKMAEFAGTVAGSRTVGQRAANISLAATEAQEMIGVVKESSDKFARSNFVPWNMALKAYESNTGTPEIAAFGASVNALVNVYVRAINPTGVPTVSDKEHARAVLNTVQSPAQVDAVLKIINRELEIAKKAPQTVKDSIRSSIAGKTLRFDTKGDPLP